MASQEEELNAHKISKEGEDIRRIVLRQLQSIQGFDDCYAVKSRAKDPEGILEKLDRKRAENSKKPENFGKDLHELYQINDITDVVGVRFVTLFRSDLPDIIELILQSILHRDGIQPNYFKLNNIEEFIFYKVPSVTDQLVVSIAEKIEKYDLTDRYEEITKEPYSSIHIVARLNRKVEGITHPNGGDYYVPIEIQVRSVFEDGWGEIDHKFSYKAEDIVNPQLIKGHLKVLKRFSDASAEYADVIREETVFHKDISPSIRTVVPVGDDDELVKRFRDLGIPDTYIGNYYLGRILRLDAGNSQESENSHSKAALHFSKLSDTITEVDLQDYKWQLFNYYSNMNEALCYLQMKSDTKISAAKSIYLGLRNDFGKHPILWHRFAQACSALGDTLLAKDAYETAWSLTTELVADEKLGSDLLPIADYNHILKYTRYSLGYNCWLLAEQSEDPDDKVRHLEQARDITESSLADPEHINVYATQNNLLYYKLDLEKLYRTLGTMPESDQMLDQAKELLNEMEQIQNSEEITDVESLDTILEAKFRLGITQETKKLADRVIDLCLDLYDSENPEVVLKIAQRAKKILRELD